MSVSSSIETSFDDRVRHESLGEDAERPQRTTRFASSTLTPDQFVNIDWMPSERDCEKTWKHKLGSWVNSLSRRTWILIISGILILLLLLSVLIVVLLIFLVGNNKDNGNAINITDDTTTIYPPTTIPFAPVTYGNVVGIQSIYYEANNCTEHLVPLNNAYQFKNKYILTCPKSVVIVPADPADPPFTFNLDLTNRNKSDCQVLSMVDRCSDNHFAGCGITDITYQCKTSDPNSSELFFSVGGLNYTNTQVPIETRVSSNSSEQQLFLALDQRTATSNIVEVHLLKSPSSTSSGVSSMPYSALTPVTVTLNTSTSLVPDYFIYIQAPFLTIAESSSFHNVFLDIESKEDLSLATGSYDNNIYIAVLASDRFYIVRQNIHTGCVSVLSSLSQIYLFPGTLSGAYWVNDKYILWYRDRTGVNVVSYTFKWDDNTGNACL